MKFSWLRHPGRGFAGDRIAAGVKSQAKKNPAEAGFFVKRG